MRVPKQVGSYADFSGIGWIVIIHDFDCASPGNKVLQFINTVTSLYF